ncbi:hypothetical protein M501DRAFT_1055734 [Patellaria atrata CBS 101060]|uniref:Spindle pole body-associated protein cut12 domain-containing protein n=1 Tax=Patellaria atrata CBS 101060 TaxID=1346257 RepID=A0A9P4SFZ0_9PEZI|nr:hypothetical protein M501DRAFT_1055734 [Patellaria atrata CBS 101060]
MLSWLTGSKPDPTTDGQIIVEVENVEPPTTPAPVFAYRACKQAIFGTPHPDQAVNQPRKRVESTNKKHKDNELSKETKGASSNLIDEPNPVSSPTKPAGILMTPGTGVKGKKTVSFGEHVKDNEGKRPSKSGIPNDCPGKFPSPWTPKIDVAPEKKAQTKLTAALYNARDLETKLNAETQQKSMSKLEIDKRTQKTAIDLVTDAPKLSRPEPRPQGDVRPRPRAKDDADITQDIILPRSESGRYWKKMFETYSANSENEVKKLVSKQQIAKAYARKKDDEAVELSAKLTEERKGHRKRERELERSVKEYQEQLRKSLADVHAASAEIAILKQRIAVLESKSTDVPVLVDPVVSPVQKVSKGRLEPTSSLAPSSPLDSHSRIPSPIKVGRPSLPSTTAPSPFLAQPRIRRTPIRTSLPNQPFSHSKIPAKSPLDATTQENALPLSAPRPTHSHTPARSHITGTTQSDAVIPATTLAPAPVTSTNDDIWAFEYPSSDADINRLALPIRSASIIAPAEKKKPAPKEGGELKVQKRHSVGGVQRVAGVVSTNNSTAAERLAEARARIEARRASKGK